MSQLQQEQFYDKLLFYLNRTFAINFKSTQLYLYITKQQNKIRFKSIKNIYTTLTQGKADEVIYLKQKSEFTGSNVSNQMYNFRMCWRMVEKLISKVAYYLSNQRKLQELSPNIIKFINFTRVAGDKVTNKQSFIKFFKEVLDLIIIQNNMLQKSIFDQLINRGYISSIDEFYRMNRFQGPNLDFVYSSINKSQQLDNQLTIHMSQVQQDGHCQAMQFMNSKRWKRSQSKITDYRSTYKLIDKLENIKNLGEQDLMEQKQSQESIKESLQSSIYLDDDNDENEQNYDSVTVSPQQSSDDLNQFNKNSHIIHQQVEKTVDELMNNKDFKAFMDTYRQEDRITPTKIDRKQTKFKKPSIIKDILKNLHLKKFQTNQKLITINQNEISRHKQHKPLFFKNTLKQHKTIKDRISVMTAVSNRIKENLYKTQCVNQFQNMIVKKINQLQGNASNKKITRGNPVSQMIKVKNRKFTHEILHQKASRQGEQQKSQTNNTRNVIHSDASLKRTQSQQNINVSNLSAFHKRSPKKNMTAENKSMSGYHLPESDMLIKRKDSNFLDSSKGFDIKNKGLKQKRFFYNPQPRKPQDFSSTLLGITAKKYNKLGYDLNQLLSSNNKEHPTLCQTFLLKNKKQHLKVLTQANEPKKYNHERKYQVYARMWRRFI